LAFLAMVALALPLAAADAPAPIPSPPQASPPRPASTLTGPAKWESQVQAYEKADQASPPPQGAVLFVGSSSIRMWKTLEEDFKPTKVLGRGIGGSTIADQVFYVDRLVLPYKPSQIVFYAGDNDLAGKKPAEQVAADYKAFVEKVRKALPDVKIHFLAIKPSPSRAALWDEGQKANRLVREYAEKTPGLSYIDVAAPMLGPDGKPKPEIFLADKLHLNRQGYELWIPLVKAALEKKVSGTFSPKTP
jgi:lysophospholipase L1-like esterase